VLYCGEIGGDKEYALADAARGFPKPVVAMLVGRHAPAEKRMAMPARSSAARGKALTPSLRRSRLRAAAWPRDRSRRWGF